MLGLEYTNKRPLRIATLQRCSQIVIFSIPANQRMYSASSLVLPLFGILTFIGISSCRRGCVWGAKFRFGVFVCLLLMFPET